MKAKMIVTSGAVSLARNVASEIRDAEESARHSRAVERYREEREATKGLGISPWWIDVGGEGDPCP
jgi:hypothetical protein